MNNVVPNSARRLCASAGHRLQLLTACSSTSVSATFESLFRRCNYNPAPLTMYQVESDARNVHLRLGIVRQDGPCKGERKVLVAFLHIGAALTPILLPCSLWYSEWSRRSGLLVCLSSAPILPSILPFFHACARGVPRETSLTMDFLFAPFCWHVTMFFHSIISGILA
jgi:hypothetical protein